ncbi:hypothetical protein ACWEBX_01075 [Streptomyces sp. NPDC005070]
MTRRKKGTADAVGYQCGPKGHVGIPKEETDRFLIGDLDAAAPEAGKPAPELGVIRRTCPRLTGSVPLRQQQVPTYL